MTYAMGYHGTYHGILGGIPIGQPMEKRMGYPTIPPMGMPSYKPWDDPWKLSSYGILHQGYISLGTTHGAYHGIFHVRLPPKGTQNRKNVAHGIMVLPGNSTRYLRGHPHPTLYTTTWDYIKYQVGPTVHPKAYIYRYFY